MKRISRNSLGILCICGLVYSSSLSEAYRAVKVIDDLRHGSGKIGTFRALIIGINDYEDERIADLSTPLSDARATSPINAHSPFGLTWDGRFLWISEYSDKHLYQINPDRAIADVKSNNAVIQKIHLPDIGAPVGWLAWDGKFIWTSDSSNIYQIKVTQ